MARIELRSYDDLKFVLKKFRKMCEKEGLFKEMRSREFYEKKSDRKRRELRQAKRRLQLENNPQTKEINKRDNLRD